MGSATVRQGEVGSTTDVDVATVVGTTRVLAGSEESPGRGGEVNHTTAVGCKAGVRLRERICAVQDSTEAGITGVLPRPAISDSESE